MRVEQYGVPATGQAVADHRPFGAVIKVQGHRHRHVAGKCRKYPEELVAAVLANGLDRRLDNHRSLFLHRGGKDGLDGQVVEDVEGGHAVALCEGAIKDLLHGYDRHGFSFRPKPSVRRSVGCVRPSNLYSRWSPQDVADPGARRLVTSV